MAIVPVDVLFHQIQQAIMRRYAVQEAKAIAARYLDLRLGINHLDIILHKEVDVPGDFDLHLQQLASGIPLQYVTGTAYFRDRLFAVSPDTLIPRPETEELVGHVLAKIAEQAKRVLDIGTGSGCIAISIALESPTAEVSAWDISKNALVFANKNAQALGANVSFSQQDVFDWSAQQEKWDLIVSNPPYVCEREAAEMEAHVLGHEPHLALFVPDNDPLLFYRVITAMAKERLYPGGYLCFEINEAFGKETCALLDAQGFQHISLLPDFHGKDRMLIAQQPDL